MKKNKIVKLIPFLTILIGSACVGFFVGKLGIKNLLEIPGQVFLLLVILCIPMFFIVIGIHEAGHALAGIKVGFDFKMYVVGPFLWEKEAHGWIFKWNKNVNTAGGLVLCLPKGVVHLSNRFMVYAAGGPIASLLWAVVSYGGYRVIKTTDLLGASGTIGLAYSFMIMALMSGMVFIITAIPFHSGGFSSDGARVLRLLKGGDVSKLEVLFLKIITESLGGTRPAALNEATLQELLQLAIQLESPYLVYVYSYLYQAAFDKNNIEQATEYLKDYLQQADAIPEGLRSLVWLDAAFFYAFAKKDLLTAQEYFSRFKPAAMIPKAMILATEAAVLLLSNNAEAGMKKIEEAQKELPNMLDKGAALALKEKLHAMIMEGVA